MQYQSVPHQRGLVMLFHGCRHEAMDWFTLPEGMTTWEEHE